VLKFNNIRKLFVYVYAADGLPQRAQISHDFILICRLSCRLLFLSMSVIARESVMRSPRSTPAT